jgi:hypothetical protein
LALLPAVEESDFYKKLEEKELAPIVVGTASENQEAETGKSHTANH